MVTEALARAPLEPRGPFMRIPRAPHEMSDRVTPTQDVMVLCHLGVPRIDRDAWSLTIDGMVARPLRFRFADLMGYPRTTIASVHHCVGNPFKPYEPTRRVANVRWTGVRLAEVLRAAAPSPDVRYWWSHGADYGEFGGIAHPGYLKDLPVERVDDDALIAYELNGAPLPAEHGFPARLVVPGFYGTNSVKWLTRLTAARSRATGAFTTRWYNEPAPAWSIAPESIVVAPAPGQTIEHNVSHEIWGWAWADRGIERVEVSVDGGARWAPAEVEPRAERCWQQFRYPWKPVDVGMATVCSRAHAVGGEAQPESGRRNAIHRVEVTVSRSQPG